MQLYNKIEKIEIENDEFIVELKIVDKMKAEELVKVVEDIQKSHEALTKDLESLPEQMKARTEHLTKEKTLMESRLEQFGDNLEQAKLIVAIQKEHAKREAK